MKSIFLTVALSASTFFGILSLLDETDSTMPECILPTVEIKAPQMPCDSTFETSTPDLAVRPK